MKPFIKYLETLESDSKLLSIYKELREEFQKLGFTEDDLEHPPTYTHSMMKLYQQFHDEKNKLMKELKSFFNDIDIKEFNDYITSKMALINELTPLSKSNKTNNDGD